MLGQMGKFSQLTDEVPYNVIENGERDQAILVMKTEPGSRGVTSPGFLVFSHTLTQEKLRGYTQYFNRPHDNGWYLRRNEWEEVNASTSRADG